MRIYFLPLIFSLTALLYPFETESFLDRSQFVREARAFVNQKQMDFARIGTFEYIQTEFALIEEFGAMQFPRRRPSVEGMDRDPRWTPFEENKITLRDDTEMSASYLHFATRQRPGYHNFIASQAPYGHNIHLFWQMIWEKLVDQVVMVTELSESKGELSAAYWPEKQNQLLSLSNGLKIKFLNERWLLKDRKESIRIRAFLVSNGEKKRVVTHYWYRNWPDQTAPNQSESILTLIKVVKQEKRRSRTQAPILVHCHGGVGRTGVFVALYHMLQRKDLRDERMNLFDCVLYMRWQRARMISRPEQYLFCYRVLAQMGA